MRSKIFLGLIVILAFLLRFYSLDQTPSSLYWDEASLGYNAFSVANTLRDEHGEFLPLTRFIAFGDYKAPGYIYAASAAIKLFDLNEFTVRLPSALAGTFLVLLTYFLAIELGLPGFLAAFFVAVSPWAIQFSRGAFEANLATLFSGLGILFFLRRAFFKSVLFFALSMYTFNSHRIFVPLIILALIVIFRPFGKKLLLGLLFLAVLLIPLAQYGLTREAKLRFDEVSWLKDLTPIELSNQRITLDHQTIFSKVIHNRRVVYSLEFLKHYTDNFRSDFLFFNGDVNPRLSVRKTGEMYLIDLPLLLAGIYFLTKRPSRVSVFLFSWALLAPIPAALARETPHALRTLNILPVPQIIAAVGLYHLAKINHKVKYLLLIVYCSLFILYVRDYFLNYSKRSEMSWQYGYKQMVGYVNSVEKKYSCISVTEFYGRSYIYFLLYGYYSPEKYWATRNVSRDWFGFWYVHGFDKYRFGDREFPNEKCLYVRPPNFLSDKPKLLQTIYNLNQEPVFEIYEKD